MVHFDGSGFTTHRSAASIALQRVTPVVFAFVAAAASCSRRGGQSGESDPRGELSDLGRGWADRLEVDFGLRNVARVRDTLSGIEDRHRLGYVTDDDIRVLRGACSAAISGDWDGAYRRLGLEGPPETPQVESPWDVGGWVGDGTRLIPLPMDADVMEYVPGRHPIDDHVWRIACADAHKAPQFFAAQLREQGWRDDLLLPDCWTRPPVGKLENDIVCVRTLDSGSFELRLTP